jgi:hypothetical protein
LSRWPKPRRADRSGAPPTTAAHHGEATVDRALDAQARSGRPRRRVDGGPGFRTTRPRSPRCCPSWPRSHSTTPRSRPRPPMQRAASRPAYAVAMADDVDLEIEARSAPAVHQLRAAHRHDRRTRVCPRGQDVTAIARVLDYPSSRRRRARSCAVRTPTAQPHQRHHPRRRRLARAAATAAARRNAAPPITRDRQGPFTAVRHRRGPANRRVQARPMGRPRRNAQTPAVQRLVHLATDTSGRSAYVAGDRPLRFLDTTRASAAWALNRLPSGGPALRATLRKPVVALADFRAAHAAHVHVVDLQELLLEMEL